MDYFKYILYITALSMYITVYAVPNIGITDLLYDNNRATDVLVKRSYDITSKPETSRLQLRHEVMLTVVKKMLQFPAILNDTLLKSGQFTTYNANNEMQKWQAVYPKLLSKLYNTTEVESLDFALNNPKTTIRGPIQYSKSDDNYDFILIGWIDTLVENEYKSTFNRSAKSAIIYNLDIRINYRLINIKTQKVVVTFVAMGHGGTAFIRDTNGPIYVYPLDLVADEVFISLAQNVLHHLQMHKNDIAKVSMQNDNEPKRITSQAK